MAKPTRSLLWAVGIVSICVAGILAFRHQTGELPWLLFAIPIWWPLWSAVVLSGGVGANQSTALPLTFLLAVLMWWGVIEGGRRLWRRVWGSTDKTSKKTTH